MYESDMDNCNRALIVLEKRLYEDGVISTPDAITRKYCITIVPRWSLSAFFKKILKWNDNDKQTYDFIVGLCPIEDSPPKKDPPKEDPPSA